MIWEKEQTKGKRKKNKSEKKRKRKMEETPTIMEDVCTLRLLHG